jgi:C1A family cysteine protease
MFIYYNARDIENATASDDGAEIVDGIKSVNRMGVCPEEDWPYDESKVTVRPAQFCYDDALKDLLLQYRSVDNRILHDLLAALVQGPVCGGFSVFESFESDEVANTGIVPMPAETEQILGGHAVLVTGYDRGTQLFKVRNSWGTSWGDHGSFTIPFAYFTNEDMASDFWLCQKVM